MKIIFLLVCFLFATLAEAQYQNSLNALETIKGEIEKVEKKNEDRVNQIERDMATDKVEDETKKDDSTQQETKN